MSDLLSVRVMAEPPAAARAVDRLAEVLDLDRRDGPYPSRKTPDLVRFYLTGRLRPAAPAPADLSDRASGCARRWCSSASASSRCWRTRPPIGSTPLSRPTAASPP